ncbi:MAG: cytochrome c1 [Robiginitomaculum sp.]|nr:MAG: cytochrome c1 [Robiginitomaculum sp.]
MGIKFMKTLIVGATLALGGLGVANVATASDAGGTHKLEHQKWGFNGMFGTYDRAAMQRGYQVYREVCASCHALEHLSFRHLADKGAPFYNADTPNPNDNDVVKAFAKDWSIEAIDQDTGDIIDRPGIPADKFPLIFPNAIAAAASNGGAIPPDLSLITKSRTGGADYLYAILTGYHEAPHDFHVADGTYYNTAFDGNQIKMAAPLSDELIEYSPYMVAGEHGAEPHEVAAPVATTDQMARDIVEFLTWAGDPHMEARKRIGLATFLYLFIFALLLFLTYKTVWRNVKH